MPLAFSSSDFTINTMFKTISTNFRSYFLWLKFLIMLVMSLICPYSIAVEVCEKISAASSKSVGVHLNISWLFRDKAGDDILDSAFWVGVVSSSIFKIKFLCIRFYAVLLSYFLERTSVCLIWLSFEASL